MIQAKAVNWSESVVYSYKAKGSGFCLIKYHKAVTTGGMAVINGQMRVQVEKGKACADVNSFWPKRRAQSLAWGMNLFS